MASRKRRLIFRTAILLLLVLAVSFTIYQLLHKNHVVKAGDQAPDFVLTNLDGKKVHLKDYRGKKVVLNFWATWCDPCKREMPYINKVYQTMNKKDVVILAVNIKESSFAVSSFKDRYHVSFPLLLDPGGDVTDAYNIQPIPTTFFINEKGKVVDKVIESMPSAKYIENKISQIKS